MFRPNLKVRLQIASGETTLYGQPKPGAWITEGAMVVKLNLHNEKSSVRADSSATRGNAMETEADAVLLLSPKTQAVADDIIELHGWQLRITGVQPRYDALGGLDHYEVRADMWKKA